MLCLVCVCGGLQQILYFETRPRLSTKDFKTLFAASLLHPSLLFVCVQGTHKHTYHNAQNQNLQYQLILLPNLPWPSLGAALFFFMGCMNMNGAVTVHLKVSL